MTDLKNLSKLYLRNNQIKELPVWITQWDMDITLEEYADGLNLYDNPIESPPVEVVKQGKEAILNYYKELNEKGKDYLYEAKMLVLGEGGSGKTSMVRRIQNQNNPLPEKEDTTRGIDVETRQFAIKKETEEQQNFRVNIWDFGGQQIYHSTHRFFLSSRALYTIVDCSRQRPTDYAYWLNMIETFGKNSPVILVPTLINAIKAAYPNYGKLEMFLDLNMDKSLANMVEKTNMQTVVFELIKTATSENWLHELIDELKKDSYNTQIQALMLKQYRNPMIKQKLRILPKTAN